LCLDGPTDCVCNALGVGYGMTSDATQGQRTRMKQWPKN
jgi:hypothetical protein